MAASKKQKTETLVDADGWESQPTVDGSEGEQTFADAEWVEPAPGTVIEGNLVRGFVTPDTLGGKKPFRACYVVMNEQGHEFTFGEKAAFKTAIRQLNIGDAIRIEFLKKEAIVIKGKRDGRTAWRVDFKAKRAGTGASIADELTKSHALAVKRGDATPF